MYEPNSRTCLYDLFVCLRSCLMQRYSQNAISSSSSLNEGLVKQQQHDAPQNHSMPSAPHQCVPFTILN
jgi:hypothetical protein